MPNRDSGDRAVLLTSLPIQNAPTEGAHTAVAHTPAFRRLLPAVVLATALTAACGGDDTIWEPLGSSLVTLSFQNLEPLRGGLNYQAWAVEFRTGSYWGSPMGIFTFDESGQMVDPSTGEVLSGSFEARVDAGDLYGVQVTIEMSDVVVSQPSGIYILGGTVANGSANLGQDSWLSLTLDLSGMSGRYFLATPSDNLDDNELSGVWFADYNGGSPFQGLVLPQAPEGWDYEAWVVMGDDTLSTGKFYSSARADTLNIYGGITGNYAFPGQDFLQNAPEGMTFPTDLSGTLVFVTMEPWEGYDVEPLSPFPFKLLEAGIPPDAVPHTNYSMTSLFDGIPRGTATVASQ
jgi:hypothetical protein